MNQLGVAPAILWMRHLDAGGGSGKLSKSLFRDPNQNGIQDFNEYWIGTSVQVQLLDSVGNIFATAWTSGAMYSFANVAAGTYRIQLIPPSGYSPSP